MEFDFNTINLLSQEPYLKINSQTSLFFVTEKQNQSKIYTLFLFDGQPPQVQPHLHCQAISQGILKLKGYKELVSQDNFGFKIQRTAWLTEPVQASLSLTQTLNQNQSVTTPQFQSMPDLNQNHNMSSQDFYQIILDISSILSDLQQEEITLKEIQPSIIVRTNDRKFKIMNVSSATNVLGMESSVQREIIGNPIYLDYETYIAQIQGDSHATQNHFKSSVYAFGISLLEIHSMKVFDRRQTQNDIELYLNDIRTQHSESIAELIEAMLLPNRADRPDCVELFQRVISVSDLPEYPKFQSHDQPKIISPPILNPDLNFNFQQSNKTNPLGIQSTNSEYIWVESKQQGNTMTSQDFTYSNQNINEQDLNMRFTQSQIKEEGTADINRFTLTQTYKSNEMMNTNLASMTSQIKLSDSLRKKVKKYQEQSGKEQFQQKTLTEVESYDDFDSSQDVIDEQSTQPLSFQTLQAMLSSVIKKDDKFKQVQVDDIKMDRTKILGKGTEGMVCLCSYQKSQNLAVKILADIDNEKALEIIITTSSIQNRNIFGIFNYELYALEPSKNSNGQSDLRCNLYLISRKMRCDLNYATKYLKLNLNDKFYIALQLAKVLQQIEGQIYHGDLKPQNILLDAENTVYLIDFGMSSLVSSNKLTESASHTYFYSPPEQCLQQKIHNKSDIWAFGIILFVVFSNQDMSMNIINKMGLYNEEEKGSLRWETKEYGSLSRLIERMTQFNYDKRPSMGEIKKDLENCYKEMSQVGKQHSIQQTPKSQASSQKTIKKGPAQQKQSQFYKQTNQSPNLNGLMVFGKKMTGAVDPRKLHDNQPQTSISRLNYQRHTVEGQTHTQFQK